MLVASVINSFVLLSEGKLTMQHRRKFTRCRTKHLTLYYATSLRCVLTYVHVPFGMYCSMILSSKLKLRGKGYGKRTKQTASPNSSS